MKALADAFRRCRVYDLSPPIRAGMPVFPGHPPVEIAAARTHLRDGYYLQELHIGEHTGSHVDAPAHALADKPDESIDSVPIERFVAPYGLYDLTHFEFRPGELASAQQLRDAERRAGIEPEPGDAALLRFGWDRYLDREDGWWAANTPGLEDEACAYLGSRGVSLVGSDTPTADTATVEGRIVAQHGHLRHFLPRGILLVEGLFGLGEIPPRGLLIAAPLKIVGGSGAPARVLAIAEERT